MTKVLALAGAAVSALVISTAFGQADVSYDASKRLNLTKIVGCQVSGTPSEFPDDIWIMNKGLGALTAGTKVQWKVPFAGKQGNYTLASTLNPGQGVKLSGVLAGGVEAGKPCAAKFI
jgi:hypothetical protein